MQKTFKNQQGREFLLTLVPSNIETVDIIPPKERCSPYFSIRYKYDKYESYTHGGYSLFYKDFGGKKKYPKELKILCLAKDATEEQAASVVDILWNGFKNYLTLDGNVGNYKILVKSTAKESLTSLLTSLGFKQDDNVLILEKI